MNTVIHVADYGGPYSGNFITALKKLDEKLKNEGLRLVLVFSYIAKDREWLSELYNRGIPVYFISKENKTSEIREQIENIVIKENAKIVHTHFSGFDIVTGLLSKTMKRNGREINLIWHMHSDFPVKRPLFRRIKEVIKYRIIGSDAYVLTVSDKLNNAVTRIGVPNKRVNTLSNGIDVQRATQITKTKNEMRNEIGLSDSTKVLLSFGWDPETKGIDLLIESVINLPQNKKTDLSLLIVGEERLKQYIKDNFNSLPEWIKVLPPRENVADLYNLADVFISASRGEGFSYSVGEAMVNNLPIISSDIPGLNWAKKSKGVFLFENNNSNSLQEEIIKFLSLSTEQKTNYGLINQKFISENYSIDNWTNYLIDFYKKIQNNFVKH